MEKSNKEKTDKEKDMDINHIRSMLLKMGEDCSRLADKIKETGCPLTNEERQLVRFSICPVIDEITSELKSAFLCGNIGWAKRSCENLKEQVLSFMK